ncbi:Phage tail assembly chaperone protein, TAC6 [uncultured Caudovirales phage]|uniref:Phage tail assembly chaperone protein, TAC6 n=1 Tax=uncultured Caudovirales phage TaxID=2100421 RepID=A0A6J5Q1N3_9CAUD|nr:Phage tail assembly chaperone protein, TAC6 [uncultured Caudovirales phage]CAB4210847.1 Phage tail assembly chaperone protein, TAC6 [uncultured Caudovirales phage]CAB4223342.1 Phage tail assembly chaperone protein, TAC6 [uncultured Caudovirales phage]
MELGLGVLGWTPKVFWSSTPHEFTAALNGYSEKNGVPSAGFTNEEIDDLQEMLDQALRDEGRL